MFILYIDPGTGSLLLSAFLGILMTLLFYIKGIYYSFINIFFGIQSKFTSNFEGKIVFYSESNTYWRVYKPIVDQLIKNEQSFIYLSSDKNDGGLKLKNPFSETFYIGNIKQSIFLLNRLKANICILTTPQLDVISLKRSKDVKHYCHVVHSPTDIHAYKKFAFDYFDSVICSSNDQILSLRYLERKRGSIHKELFPVGCTYYDLSPKLVKNTGKAILIAPTWGDRTFFKKSGKELIRILISLKHQIIFRPHPQSWISDKIFLNEIISEFKSNSLFKIDKNIDSESSLNNSKLMICDLTSGMLFDMAFLYKKPVIAINFDWRDGGYESSTLKTKNSAIKLINDVGKIINVDEIKDIKKILVNVSQKKITNKIISNHIFNFKNSGELAAQKIIMINNRLD